MNIAVIFAGGVGQRMGASIPKQFLQAQEKPILIHTLEKFQYHEEIDKIYIACKEDFIPKVKNLVKKYNITKIPENGIVPGGKTGQDSIYNGLCAVAKENDENSIVLIHDGVRPIIDHNTISANIESVKKYGSAITATPAYETPIISYDGSNVDALPQRKNLYTAQAPQSFRLKDILGMHEKVRKENPNYTGIIDSCTLMELNGFDVRLIEGNRGNIKITTYTDFIDFIGRLYTEDLRNYFELMTVDEKKKEFKLTYKQEMK